MAEGPYEYQARFVRTIVELDKLPHTVVGEANALASDGYRLFKVEQITGEEGNRGLLLIFERRRPE